MKEPPTGERRAVTAVWGGGRGGGVKARDR
jgi:hypothetical protein